ncbi:MAG: FAD-binding protein [Deltaproteobacteria bacterium]|nr:FAD-binding protein [Deltaproteobacteria bacterium]
MSYPIEMQESLQKLAANRADRREASFDKMEFAEKEALLKAFHPDFRSSEKTTIRVGPNEGDTAPKELVALLESPSSIDPAAFDLTNPDLETDILVVGGGGGALSAALSAHERGARVLVVTKLRLGDSNTIMAEGGIAAATHPEDSPAIHFVDTMVGGRHMNVPELVEALVNDAPFILDWLSSLGVNFDRRDDGSYFAHMPGGHSRRRSHSIKDLTGLEIMRVLCDELRTQGIEVLEFSPAVELVLDEYGRCAGAVLYDFDSRRHRVVKAKIVILATGGMGRLHPLGFPTSNHYGATADGLIMAYRAGAALLYAGYVQYHPTGAAWPEQMLGLLISEALRAQGAQLVNAEGVVFVNRLETRDAVSAAIIRECNARGLGVTTPTGMLGVWLDTPLIDLIGGPGTFIHRFAGIAGRFRKYGIDPVTEPILVFPTQHYQNGGVRIDARGRSDVPGLYVVGEASGGVHGHNRLGANSLVDVFVFGRRAGNHAASVLPEVRMGRPSLDHVVAYEQALKERGIVSDTVSPILLPDYRFEKALTSVGHASDRAGS